MIVKLKCPRCKTTELNQKEIEFYSNRSLMQGFQCLKCDSEASLFIDDVQVRTDLDLSKFRDLVIQGE